MLKEGDIVESKLLGQRFKVFDPYRSDEPIALTGAQDILIWEDGEDPGDGLTLYGFDEIGRFDYDFERPVYGYGLLES